MIRSNGWTPNRNDKIARPSPAAIDSLNGSDGDDSAGARQIKDDYADGRRANAMHASSSRVRCLCRKCAATEDTNHRKQQRERSECPSSRARNQEISLSRSASNTCERDDVVDGLTRIHLGDRRAHAEASAVASPSVTRTMRYAEGHVFEGAARMPGPERLHFVRASLHLPRTPTISRSTTSNPT